MQTERTNWCGECLTHAGKSVRDVEKDSERSKNGDSGRARNQLLTERDAARYLGMSRSFLSQSCMNGNLPNRTPGLPYIRFGRSIRYRLCDLDEWINEHGYRG